MIIDLITLKILCTVYGKGKQQDFGLFKDSGVEFAEEIDVIGDKGYQGLLIFWDGASYHKSKQLRAYLSEVNQGLEPEDWKIHCVLFAPNDPTQNPVEDVLLQAKTWLRRMSGVRPCFKALKALFEQFFTLDTFDFPKLYMYGKLSALLHRFLKTETLWNLLISMTYGGLARFW